MRYFLIALIINFSFAINFLETTEKLISIEHELMNLDINETNESVLTNLITQKDAILKSILLSDKSKTLEAGFDIADYSDRLNLLKQRIKINGVRDNLVAVYRDELEVKKIRLYEVMYKALNYSADEQSELRGKKQILKFLEKIKADFDIKISIEIENLYIKYKNIESVSVVSEFKKSYENFIETKVAYLDIVNFFIKNVDKLDNQNIIIKVLKISYLEAVLNNLEYIKSINLYLNHYFDIKLGKLIVAIFIFFIFLTVNLYFLYLVFKIKRDSQINRFIKSSLKLPLQLFILIYGFEIAVKNSFEFSEVLENFNSFYIILLIFAIYRLINNAILYFSENILLNYPNIRQELINFLIVIFKIFLFIILLLVILKELGYNITAIVASLGVGGIAIALAAKDTLTNFFGLINIILDNSFSQGDIIKTDNFEGSVVEIGIRSTTIRTFTNELVTIPNSKLSDGIVINMTKRKIGRRIKFYLKVSFDSDRESIEEVVSKIEKMLIEHSEIADDSMQNSLGIVNGSKILKLEDALGVRKTLAVFVDNLSPYSIDILIYCYAKSTDWLIWSKTKEDIILKSLDIVKESNLKLVYPINVTKIECS